MVEVQDRINGLKALQKNRMRLLTDTLANAQKEASEACHTYFYGPTFITSIAKSNPKPENIKYLCDSRLKRSREEKKWYKWSQ